MKNTTLKNSRGGHFRLREMRLQPPSADLPPGNDEVVIESRVLYRFYAEPG